MPSVQLMPHDQSSETRRGANAQWRPCSTHLAAIATCAIALVCNISYAAQSPKQQTDQWFVVSFNDNPIGFERLRVDHILADGRPMLACYRKTQMNLKRLGQDLTVRASLWTRQSSDGTLNYFRLQRVDGAGARIERTGVWDGDRRVFHVNERVAATRRKFDIRTSGPVRSPLLSTWVTQVVARQGNSTTTQILFPESANVVNVAISPQRSKFVRMQNAKSINATRFDLTPQLEPAKRTAVFVDGNRDGRLVRTEQSILGGTLSIHDSSPEMALNATAGSSLSIDLLAPIPTTSLLNSSTAGGPLVLQLSVAEGFLPEVPETAFQKVQVMSDTTAQLTLTRPDVKLVRTTPVSFTRHSALASTHWMPLEDVRVQRMAATGAAGATNAFDVCQRLERMVQAKLKYSAFSTSLVPANEVARTLRGDCTEHAILLAALMRVKGIPSRVASGLVHSNQQFGFTGHAWVEALIGNEWVPFDSSAATASLELTHIKLTDSELADAENTGIFLFLPLLDLAGQAQISVLTQ